MLIIDVKYDNDSEIEEEILKRFAEDPKLSTRHLGFQVRVSKDANRIVKEQLLDPFHIQTLQDLLAFDPDQFLPIHQRAESPKCGFW